MNAAASIRGDNRVVQGLWVGGGLSAMERLCVRSYCAHGHEFHLYHYDELRNVPNIDGLRLMDAAEILPRAAIFRRRDSTLSCFADQFRFELLRQRGGWWADMDTACVRPLEFEEDIVFPEAVGRHLWNWILKFPAGHPLAAAIANAYSDVDRFLPWDDAKTKLHKLRRRLLFWRDSRRYITAREAGGMMGLKAAVLHFGLEKHAQPAGVFCGDDPTMKAGNDWNDFLSAAPELRVTHFGNSSIIAHGFDKDGIYPADSLYELLKRRYPEER